MNYAKKIIFKFLKSELVSKKLAQMIAGHFVAMGSRVRGPRLERVQRKGALRLGAGPLVVAALLQPEGVHSRHVAGNWKLFSWKSNSQKENK